MKPFNFYKALLLVIISFISFPILAQSGSYTLTPGDLGSTKVITIPANVPVKITCSYNQNVYADIWTEYDEYNSDGPDSWQITTVTPDGYLYVYCGSEGNGGPYNFTLNWVAGSYSTTEVSYIHGNSIIDGSVGIGTLSPSGKLDIFGSKQVSLRSYNFNQSPGGSYGIYNYTNNYSGPVYGIYSYVYGGGTQGQCWAGYFAGGDVEVNGGDLYQNSENSVITIKDDNIGLVKKSGGSAVWAVGSGYNHRFGKWSTTTLKRNISSGTFTEQMRIDNNGNVGIGTTSPKAKLDVGAFINGGQLGTIFGRLPEGNTTGDGTYLGVVGYGTQPADYNSKSFSIEHHFWGQTNSSINFFRGGSYTGGYITFNTNNNTERLRIDPAGNVGIGTTTPDAMLTVNGTIHAKEVTVNLDILADYVFKPTYKLMPLHEVEQFVNINSHLPEMPSAAEVSKNGLNMGEMQNKLLQKVEELTLYMIDQQKTINQQSAKIEELEKKLK